MESQKHQRFVTRLTQNHANLDPRLLPSALSPARDTFPFSQRFPGSLLPLLEDKNPLGNVLRGHSLFPHPIFPWSLPLWVAESHGIVERWEKPWEGGILPEADGIRCAPQLSQAATTAHQESG